MTSIIGKLFFFLLKKLRVVLKLFVLLASARMLPVLASVSEPSSDTETAGGIKSQGTKPIGPRTSSEAAPVSFLMSVTVKLKTHAFSIVLLKSCVAGIPRKPEKYVCSVFSLLAVL
nr:hypothetical protein [uncultured Roseibium sp.]